MSTPILTKKQQRKSLSAKKTPAKGSRNVLAQPFERYWPVLEDNCDGGLEELLKRLMPAVKRSSAAVPWAQLRKMKRSERREARKEAQEKLNISPPDQNKLDSIVMGVNAVTRLLEKNDACCALLDAKVEPLLLVRHIVSMAVSRNVPIILVPFLKSATLEAIGFTCAAFALKKTVEQSPDNHFHSLYEKIKELAADFPAPNGPLELFCCEESMEISPTVEENQNIVDEKKCVGFTLSTSVYKYRTSRKERIFVPGNSAKVEKTDYIAVADVSDLLMDDLARTKKNRNRRYIDLHEERKNVSSGSKNEGFISFSSEPEKTESEEIKSGFSDLSKKKIGSSGRYMDLHEETRNVSSGSKNEGFISFSSEPEKIDSEEIKSEFSEFSKKKIGSSGRYMDLHEETRNVSSGSKNEGFISFSSEPEPKKSIETESKKQIRKNNANGKKNRDFGYRSLKVKRLQGNSNRVKATKIPKSKKK